MQERIPGQRPENQNQNEGEHVRPIWFGWAIIGLVIILVAVALLFARNLFKVDSTPPPPPLQETGKPTADFGVHVFATDNLTVEFDGSVSSDPKGITKYVWNFGDGYSDSTSGKKPVHKYKSAGTYTVRLTVTNVDAKSHFVEKKVTVTGESGQPPETNGKPQVDLSNDEQFRQAVKNARKGQ